MNTDIINHQQLSFYIYLTHAVEKARLKWEKRYSWLPGEQHRLLNAADRIYKETCKKYGDSLFQEFANEERLTNWYCSRDQFSFNNNYTESKRLKNRLQKYIPFFYCEGECSNSAHKKV
uniref:Uncharacterized protein n=1 Tax=Glossina palpalis gambiensis TaxID=67801 RepID=A0A1B0C597_9MUSC